MRIRISDTVAETGQLMRRFGVSLYIDFLAVGLFATTVQSLVAPASLQPNTGASQRSILELFLDPFVILHETLFTVVMAAACLRIWARLDPGARLSDAQLWGNLLPLAVLNFAIGLATFYALALFVVPGLLLSALFTALIPVIVLEDKGWDALPRTMALTRGSLMRLTALWAMLLIPWIILSIAMDPSGRILPDASAFDVWRAHIFADLHAPLMAAIATCLTLSCYRQMLDKEQADADVFR